MYIGYFTVRACHWIASLVVGTTQKSANCPRRFIFDHILAIDMNDRTDLVATVKCPGEAVSAGPSPERGVHWMTPVKSMRNSKT